ncbi:MAG: hypothetical protein J2P31_00980, partial [Blastocatellia bacterium]|nr:hypothetical protein [Blastocatellia bacterium]
GCFDYTGKRSADRLKIDLQTHQNIFALENETDRRHSCDRKTSSSNNSNNRSRRFGRIEQR